MKEITTNGITILLVEVPEDAKEQWILNGFIHVGELQDDAFSIKLPSGQYQILGKSTELSEEQMKEICEHDDSGYIDYVLFRGHLQNYCETVQESYLSLLEANGIVDRNPISDEQKNVDRFWQVEWQESQSKVKHYLVLKRI